MGAAGRDGKTSTRARYFDRFWGCPGCRRTLSIAEVIERHCEGCDTGVQPVEMVDGEPAVEMSEMRRSLP